MAGPKVSPLASDPPVQQSPPPQECDVLMRGGVTSGVVYPGAILAIARAYRLRSIGGTSAGALAAVVAAGVEYGRRSGSNPDSLKILEDVPANLGEDKTSTSPRQGLVRLFQPEKKLAPVFDLFISSLGATTEEANRAPGMLRFLRLATWRAFRFFPIPGLFWTWPGVLALGSTLLVARNATGWDYAAAAILVVLSLGIAIAGGAIAALYTAAGRVLKLIPASHYGFCSGLTQWKPGQRQPDGETKPSFPPPNHLALTDWLHWTIQSAAGLRLDAPLTFRNLWEADKPADEGHAIDLMLVTTNISRGIQHCFPELERDKRLLLFAESDMEKLMPPTVLSYMRSKGEARLKTFNFPIKIAEFLKAKKIWPLPEGPDLPILLGARMSLSFPLLLRQVKLREINWKVLDKLDVNTAVPAEILRPIWFSDGGLTSNFPIHLFDGPVPKRPTFGINLVYGESTDEEDRKGADSEADPWAKQQTVPGQLQQPSARVSLALTNSGGQTPAYKDFEKATGRSGAKKIAAFAGTLLDTARNWGDTEMMTQPGYRDRVANVRLEEGEGGFNLNMPGKIIKAMNGHGLVAGQALVDRFTNPTNSANPLGWENHCWVRYRSLFAALEEMAVTLGVNWHASNTIYPTMLNTRLPGDGKSYPWQNLTQRDYATGVTSTLLGLLRAVHSQPNLSTGLAKEMTFDISGGRGRAPRPKPKLRMMPRPRQS